MATAMKEIKYSYLDKEFKIALVLVAILIIYYLIIQEAPRWLPDNESDISIIIVVGIIWFNSLFRWTIWKLAGGWKE